MTVPPPDFAAASMAAFIAGVSTVVPSPFAPNAVTSKVTLAVRPSAAVFMEALDCADPNLNVPVRGQTQTALSALALWNDRFIVRQSQEFARNLDRAAGDLRARLVTAFRRALGRSPRADELDALAARVDAHAVDRELDFGADVRHARARQPSPCSFSLEIE